MIEQTINSPLQDNEADAAKEHILVVEPDLCERRVLQLALGENYAFCFAGDIDTALRVPGGLQCKVAIFDAGAASARDIAELCRFKAGNALEIPIILLASDNSFEIERKVAAIGVFYHLVRPYSVKDLEELIEAALRYWQRTFGWTNEGDKA